MLIIEAGLPAPVAQVRVRDERGFEVARVDLAYPAAKIAIEYEGDHHRTSKTQWRRDIARIRRLHALGWVVLRVTADDLERPADLLLQLRYWLATRA